MNQYYGFIYLNVGNFLVFESYDEMANFMSFVDKVLENPLIVFNYKNSMDLFYSQKENLEKRHKQLQDFFIKEINFETEDYKFFIEDNFYFAEGSKKLNISNELYGFELDGVKYDGYKEGLTYSKLIKENPLYSDFKEVIEQKKCDNQV